MTPAIDPPHDAAAQHSSQSNWNWQNHEARISELERQSRRQSETLIRTEAVVEDTKKSVENLRKEILGDRTRLDQGGIGAIALVRNELVAKIDAQTEDIKEIVGRSAGRRTRLGDRWWNVMTIVLSTALVGIVYLLLHFLPAAKP
jgi:hypothetical protein